MALSDCWFVSPSVCLTSTCSAGVLWAPCVCLAERLSGASSGASGGASSGASSGAVIVKWF